MLAALVLLLSCAPDGSQPVPSPRESTSHDAGNALPDALATPGEAAAVPNADRRKPLRALGPCEDAPNRGRADEVQGLVLPPDAIVTKVSPAGPLTNVQGYLPMTPVEARAFYQRHEGLTILSVEDEVFESEVLFALDDRRVFVKSQAVCERGSVFVAVIAPDAQP